jgi:hypothetical protein
LRVDGKASDGGKLQLPNQMVGLVAKPSFEMGLNRRGADGLGAAKS